MDWQPIETAPRGELVLLRSVTGFICSGVPDLFDVNGHWMCKSWINLDKCIDIHATHWMPLPNPPSTGERR